MIQINSFLNKSSQKKVAIFIMLILCISFPSRSENSNSKPSISGRVADSKTKTPIEYATIAIFNKKDSTIVTGSITDKDGFFNIDKIEEGYYNIEVRLIGYKTLRLENIHIKKSYNLGYLLLDAEFHNLSEVEITAERNPIEYKIDKQIINVSSNITVSNGNAVDVLKQSPSISVDNDENVSLRGSADFLLFIDDKIVTSNKADILKQLSASQIEHIEIITNPSARYDAAGAAGIINIRTKRLYSQNLSGLINTRAGFKNKYNGDIIMKKTWDKADFQLSGSYLNNKNYNSSSNSLISSDAETQGTINNEVSRVRQRITSLISPEATYRFSKKTQLTTSASWMYFKFHSLINTDYTHLINQNPSFYVSDDNFLISANEIQGNFFLKHVIDTAGKSLDFSGYITKWIGLNDQSINQYYSNNNHEKNAIQLKRGFYEDHFNDRYELSANYKHIFKNGMKSESGVNYNYRYFSADKATTQLDTLSGLWHINPLYSGIHSFSEDMKSLYWMLAGQIKNYSIQAGLRSQLYNRITDIPEQQLYIDFQKLYFFPSLHISTKGKNHSQWQLSFSRRINLPHDWFTSPVPYYNDGFIVQTGNPYLKPELYSVAELNHIRFVKQQMVSVSLYSRYTNNATERITSKDTSGVYIISHDNLADKLYYGLEGGTNIKFSKKMSLSLFGNIYSVQAFMHNTSLSENYSQYSYSSRFNLQYKPLKNTSFELSGSYQGKERESYGTRAPIYSVNFGLRQNLLNNKLNITFTANDIFKTYCYQYTEKNNNFQSKLIFRGEYPVFFIGISYKINDFKAAQLPVNNNSQSPGI